MDRITFIEGLRAFHESQGRAFRPPKVAGITLDIYKMFLLIISRGGFSRVNKNSRWFVFAKPMGIPIPDGEHHKIGLGIKSFYINWLREYEKVLDESIKVAMAVDFASTNPSLVPNQSYITTNLGLNVSHSLSNNIPLTRSAAASALNDKQSTKVSYPTSQNYEIVNEGNLIDTKVIQPNVVYYIGNNSEQHKNYLDTRSKVEAECRILNMRSNYLPIETDPWKLILELKNPNFKIKNVLYSLNSLQLLASCNYLNFRSFPSLPLELAEMITNCTFALDSVMYKFDKYTKKRKRDLKMRHSHAWKKMERKERMENRVCLLFIPAFHKHVLATLTNIVNESLSNVENMELITGRKHVGNNLFKLIARDGCYDENDDGDEDINVGDEKIIDDLDYLSIGKTNNFYESIGSLHIYKKSYLKNGFCISKDFYASLGTKNGDIHDHNNQKLASENLVSTRTLKSLTVSLITAFRTCSSIIIAYEKCYHEESTSDYVRCRIAPKISEDRYKKIFLEVKPGSSNFLVSEDNLTISNDGNESQDTLRSANNFDVLNFASMKTVREKKVEKTQGFAKDQTRLPSYNSPTFPIQYAYIESLKQELKPIWITLYSITETFKRCIPYLVEEIILDEFLALSNSCIHAVFDQCCKSEYFFIPNRKLDKLYNGRYILPCLICCDSGYRYLAKIMEFGCTFVLFISSDYSIHISQIKSQTLKNFYQTLLRLASICISNYNDEPELQNKEHLSSSDFIFVTEVFQNALALVTILAENLSFDKIFAPADTLQHHHLRHHTNFTESLLASEVDVKQNKKDLASLSDNVDSFIHNKIVVLWGRQVIGPIICLLKNKMFSLYGKTTSSNSSNSLMSNSLENIFEQDDVNSNISKSRVELAKKSKLYSNTASNFTFRSCSDVSHSSERVNESNLISCELPLECLMACHFLIHISSILLSIPSKKESENSNIGYKTSKELAVDILFPFIDIFIEIAWLPSKMKDAMWSIIEELCISSGVNFHISLSTSKVNISQSKYPHQQI
ncbi:ARID/BRIGHT DNA binding domain-containing protein [Cryptosporidium serpentis]